MDGRRDGAGVRGRKGKREPERSRVTRAYKCINMIMYKHSVYSRFFLILNTSLTIMVRRMEHIQHNINKSLSTWPSTLELWQTTILINNPITLVFVTVVTALSPTDTFRRLGG